ncbi:hypothetical protein Tco_0980867 [Tanacetum coccineum]
MGWFRYRLYGLIGLITTHGHNKSGCIVGERKMDFTFFSQLIKMLPGETSMILVWFHKLFNDMRNIRMTMPNIQLNSKFVNNMSPEWDSSDGRVDVSECSRADNIRIRIARTLAQGKGAARNDGTYNRARNDTAGQGMPMQNSDYFKDKMLLMQVQENRAVLDEEELLFLADECVAFDSDVDDEPTAQSIFMANLSSTGPANQQASLSNASILSKVLDLENAIDTSDNNQVKHEIHNEVQQSTIIDSTSADMGNSNVIPYEQYLTTNDISIVPSCASSVPHDTHVLIDNDACAPQDPYVTKLAIYKEQVAIYEQRAKFELTEREHRMDDQMRILIQEHNQMEEKFKHELHSIKL